MLVRLSFVAFAKLRIISPHDFCVRMVFAQYLLVDSQRSLIEGQRLRILPLILVEFGKIVQAEGRVGMLGSQHLFIDSQRSLIRGEACAYSP